MDEEKVQDKVEDTEETALAQAQSEDADDGAAPQDPWRVRYEAMSAEMQNRLQIIVGAAVAILIGVLLFVFDTSETPQGILPSWNFIVALGLALILPRMLEKKLGASLQMFRKILLYGIVVAVVAMIAFLVLSGKI